MHMQKLDISRFMELVKDQRVKTLGNDPKLHFYYHNPLDVRGNPSHFVFVVLIDSHKNGGVYCAGSKFNVEDKEFSREVGLAEACNRLWCEYRGMKTNYGKGYKSKSAPKKPALPLFLSFLLEEMRRDIMGIGYLKPAWKPNSKQAKLLTSKLSKEAVHATKKLAH